MNQTQKKVENERDTGAGGGLCRNTFQCYCPALLVDLL